MLKEVERRGMWVRDTDIQSSIDIHWYKNNNIYMKLKVMVKEVEDGVCFEGFVVVGPVGLRVVGFWLLLLRDKGGSALCIKDISTEE